MTDGEDLVKSRRSRPGHGSLSTAVVVVIATVISSAVCVSAILWLRDESLSVVEQTPGPIWAEVSLPARTITRTLTFDVTRTEAEAVPSNGGQGIVTVLRLRRGDTLDPFGPAPLQVDGIERPWYVADAPLYREISLRDAGVDVDELAKWLDVQGIATGHEAGEAVDEDYLRAVRAWSERMGWGKTATSFSPTWVTWLPPSKAAMSIESVDAMLGAPLPSPGSSLFTVGGGLAAAVPSETDSSAGSPLAGTSSSVRVGEQLFPYEGGALSIESLTALEEVLPQDQDSVQLVVEDTFPTNVVAVPSSAVWQPNDGEACLVVALDEFGSDARAIRIPVLGGKADSAFVQDVDGFVLVNPGLFDRQEC